MLFAMLFTLLTAPAHAAEPASTPSLPACDVHEKERSFAKFYKGLERARKAERETEAALDEFKKDCAQHKGKDLTADRKKVKAALENGRQATTRILRRMDPQFWEKLFGAEDKCVKAIAAEKDKIVERQNVREEKQADVSSCLDGEAL